MEIINTKFSDAKLIIPDVYEDHRGFFKETYQNKRFLESGLSFQQWPQDSVSFSHKKYTIRGMHGQPNMAKLVQVLQGQVFDVIIDLRKESPTYKEWQGFILSSDNHNQLLIPIGFAHGFMTLTKNVVFHYKMSALHNKDTEYAIRWDSKEIGIQWPEHKKITISQKDKVAKETI